MQKHRDGIGQGERERPYHQAGADAGPWPGAEPRSNRRTQPYGEYPYHQSPDVERDDLFGRHRA
jgi:hypothetical protein